MFFSTRQIIIMLVAVIVVDCCMLHTDCVGEWHCAMSWSVDHGIQHGTDTSGPAAES